MPSGYPILEEIFPALCPAKSPANPQNRPQKSLKNDVKDDLIKRGVWFNDLELADYHIINNKKILCVFDKYDAALAATDSGRSTNKGAVVMAGLQSDTFLLFIRVDEYDGSPRTGQPLTVDGQKLYVHSSIVYDGVFEIILRGGALR
ncbi:MAG: hypothetical protein LBT23_10565 [Synergistaceae bacterium]|jgi:hypothetical protein|nr:hypothetical protein [Synergistaceae bacterium]